MTMHTLGEIAARFGLELRGDAATEIRGVATLADAGPGQLGFLANPRYRTQLASTRADAIVLRAGDADAFPRAALIAPDPYVAFAREQGYDIIVPSPVVYASARVDITDQVLERLRKQFREKPAGATP